MKTWVDITTPNPAQRERFIIFHTANGLHNPPSNPERSGAGLTVGVVAMVR